MSSKKVTKENFKKWKLYFENVHKLTNVVISEVNWIELKGQQVLIELLESDQSGLLRANVVDVSAPCVFARRAEIHPLSTGHINRLRMRGSVLLFRLA